MTTKYAKKNICAISRKVDTINDEFDIFFYTVGWESRFTEILNHLGKSFVAKKNIVISFVNDRKKGYDPAKKSEFVKKLSAHTNSEPELYEFDYLNFDEFSETINNLIYEELRIKQRPLKIGIEISSCPRYYFLSIFTTCITKNYTSDFSLFYSEGEYIDAKEEEEFDEFFNSYGKNTKTLHYSGSTKKQEKTTFVFSLGFESKFIIDEIMQNEPNHIIFLCANPGYTPEYAAKVENEIKRVVEFCELPDEMYSRGDATAGDAINAWKNLEEKLIINQKNAHIVHYVIGTKPHCLAMALNGLISKNATVKYRIVKKYKEIEVKTNKQFWRYSVINLSVP